MVLVLAVLAMIAFEESVHAGKLHKAAKAGDLDRVQRLSKAGAKLDAKNKRGFTVLHNAAQKGHTAVIQALLKAGANIDDKDQRGRTALQDAARKGYAAAVEVLLNAGATTPDTPQRNAAQGRPGYPWAAFLSPYPDPSAGFGKAIYRKA